MNENKRIVFLLSHPIQYFSPLFQKMAKEYNIDLLVLYCSDENVKGHLDKGFGVQVEWDIPLLEGYNYKFLKNNSWKPSVFNGFWGLMNFSVLKELKNMRGSYIIIHGWNNFTNIYAIILGKIFGLIVCLRADNPLSHEFLKPKFYLFIRKILLGRILFKFFDYFFYFGKENKKLYQYYGVDDKKLVFTPHAVDNERFNSEYIKLKDYKNELRKELNLPQNKVIILFVGKLIEKKNPLNLINAYRLLNNTKAALVFLGEGKLRNEIEDFIKTYNLKNVLLVGFKNQTEVGKYFASADIFVLPSGAGETWGLVVNEAMNFALPVIVSDLVGCASDLVTDDNGFIFKTLNELAEYLRTLINNPEHIKQKGNASLKRIADYSYNKIVESLLTI